MYASYTSPTSGSEQYDGQGTLRILKVANFMDLFHSSMIIMKKSGQILDLPMKCNKVWIFDTYKGPTIRRWDDNVASLSISPLDLSFPLILSFFKLESAPKMAKNFKDDKS